MSKLNKKQIILIAGMAFVFAFYLFFFIRTCQGLVSSYNANADYIEKAQNGMFGDVPQNLLDSQIADIKATYKRGAIESITTLIIQTIIYTFFITFAAFYLKKELRIKNRVNPPTL